MSTPSPTPYPVTRIAHIQAAEREPAWLIQSLWGAQAVGFIGGTPKSCKTWLALEMAVAVASGRPCLGRFEVCSPGSVLVVAAEDSAANVRRRVQAIAKARSVALKSLAVGLILEPSLRLDRPGDQLRLEATLAKIKPRMLVLDPLVRLYGGDENSARETSSMLAYLRGLQRAHQVSILLVHHVRKSASGGQPGQALSGSGDLHAWADSNLFLLHRKGQLWLHGEHRNHPAPEPVSIALATEPEHLVLQEAAQVPPPSPADALSAKVLDALRREPMHRGALRDKLRVRNATLGLALESLEKAGAICREDGRLTVPRSSP